jgi:O-antigen/teichoic acid export membrane protein
MWRFGIASFITRTASQLIYQSGNIVVMIFFGPAMVALYSVASMLIQYGEKLVEQIGSAFYPSIMKAGSLGDPRSLERIFVWYARLAFYFGGLIYMGFVVFGRQFIDLWLGSGFEDAATVLSILSFSELLSHFGRIGWSILFSLDKIRFNLLLSICEAIATIVLALAFIGLFGFGIEGVALGILTSMVATRAIAHPLYTTACIGINYRDYVAEIGSRVGILLPVSFIVFTMIGRQQLAPTWIWFFSEVAIGVIMYLPVAAFIMFRQQDLMLFWRKWLRLRSESERESYLR